LEGSAVHLPNGQRKTCVHTTDAITEKRLVKENFLKSAHKFINSNANNNKQQLVKLVIVNASILYLKIIIQFMNQQEENSVKNWVLNKTGT
jgi:hypothetical protein